MKRQIDQQIGAFIEDHVDSVHTLEVLLMLYREPSRLWTTEDIHERVQSSPGAVKASLLSLVAAKLARQPVADRDEFIYHAPVDGLAEAVGKLAALYENRPTRVIEFIYSRPTARRIDK